MLLDKKPESIYWFLDTQGKYKDTVLKRKDGGWGNVMQTTNQKKAGRAMLISDNKDLGEEIFLEIKKDNS